MKKYKALYQAMYDDLKDADMMIDYACGIVEHSAEDKPLADEFARYAKQRLEHFMSFHKLFEAEMKRTATATSADVSHCLWDETHKHAQDWYNCIQQKISKY